LTPFFTGWRMGDITTATVRAYVKHRLRDPKYKDTRPQPKAVIETLDAEYAGRPIGIEEVFEEQ